MRKVTLEWMTRAEEDLKALSHLDVLETPNVAGVQAQQAVEKFLKAVWLELGSPLPFTHDLEELYVGIAAQTKIHLDEKSLVMLTPFGTSARYPAKKISPTDARWAVQFALETCGQLKSWLLHQEAQ
jgi:HEPN domain-containing protein